MNINKKIEEQCSKDLWFNFFNEYLYENGIISEDEKYRMITKIKQETNKGVTS